MVHRVLLVDPDDCRLDALRRWIGSVVDLTACATLWKARHELLTTRPAFLITTVRLGAHNGLHLVHRAPSTSTPSRLSEQRAHRVRNRWKERQRAVSAENR